MARSRFNLLCFPSALLDPPSFYRALGPLAALRRKRPSLQVQVTEQINWASLALADGVMLQRPYRPNDLTVAQMCQKHGIPLWVEHDDNIFQIPHGNPAHDQYMTPDVHQRIARICQIADVVTCSTAHLAERFGQVCREKPVVVRNALMTNLVGHVPLHDGQPRMNAVMWRGSNTHQRDLDAFTLEMVKVAAENPDTLWLWQGIGPNNYRLLEMIPKSKKGKSLDPLDYFVMLTTTRPRVVVVPLADHPFNHSKSNIAYLEAIYAGAICVAPDWDEWRHPGVLGYSDRESFHRQLDRAIKMPADELDAEWRRGRDYVENSLTIDVVNNTRSAVLDRLEAAAYDPGARDAIRSRSWAAVQ